jgi:hypothetical protein
MYMFFTKIDTNLWNLWKSIEIVGKSIEIYINRRESIMALQCMKFFCKFMQIWRCPWKSQEIICKHRYPCTSNHSVIKSMSFGGRRQMRQPVNNKNAWRHKLKKQLKVSIYMPWHARKHTHANEPKAETPACLRNARVSRKTAPAVPQEGAQGQHKHACPSSLHALQTDTVWRCTHNSMWVPVWSCNSVSTWAHTHACKQALTHTLMCARMHAHMDNCAAVQNYTEWLKLMPDGAYQGYQRMDKHRLPVLSAFGNRSAAKPENPWKSIKIYENPLNSMKIDESQFKSMEIHENQWKSMEINKKSWKSMQIYENAWKSWKSKSLWAGAVRATSPSSTPNNRLRPFSLLSIMILQHFASEWGC